MLHPVPELSQYGLGNIDRVLGHEVDADPLGADEPHHLLNLVEQRLGGVVEEQMGLVEKEDEFGVFRIAHLG